MTPRFERARPEQLPQVEHILRAGFTHYAEKVGYALRADEYAWLPEAIGAGRVNVAREADVLLGLVVTTRQGDALEIDFVVTDLARQGAGIGRWMLTQLETEARHDGIATLTLHTAAIRRDLVAFYRRLGFVETHQAPPTHGRDTHMRIHMRKTLT